MLGVLLSLLLLPLSSSANGTVCRWDCGNARCNSTCSPVCQPPSCEVITTPSGLQDICAEPQCITVCPDNGGAADPNQECPLCETLCEAPSCPPPVTQAEIQCGPPQCSWQCRAPKKPYESCIHPVCFLVCDPPACGELATSDATAAAAAEALLLLALLGVASVGG
jgi:hypothetical protein